MGQGKQIRHFSWPPSYLASFLRAALSRAAYVIAALNLLPMVEKVLLMSLATSPFQRLPREQ